jgi:hypothetical protein
MQMSWADTHALSEHAAAGAAFSPCDRFSDLAEARRFLEAHNAFEDPTNDIKPRMPD